MIALNGCLTHVRDSGPADAPTLLFSNSLGTDMRIWDRVIARLPTGWRMICYDTRGHGLSDAPPAPYDMGTLVADAAALLDALEVRNCVVVGLSIGGMIAQGLAAERPDLVAGLVLSNTAVKIGTEAMWNARIEAIRSGGIAAIEEAILQRWFSPAFHRDRGAELAGWRNMLRRTPVEGYLGCCAAIRDTDLWESTSRLRVPALVFAGAADGATPPDLVRETAGLIPGAAFDLIAGAGHLPCIEAPERIAERLTAFVREGVSA